MSPATSPEPGLHPLRRNGIERRGFRRRRWRSSASSALWACWCPRNMAAPAPTMSAMRWRMEEIAAGEGAVVDDPLRAEFGRLHAGAAIRLGGAEAALSGADGEGRDARLLLPDRAAGRLRRRGDQDTGASARQSLGAQRHQAVHQLGQERRSSRSSLR